ncbi:MAG: MerR family transcriptional regulator [Deltaproteobacteria bacterium HGW-Deltaproteobacteria-20]|jgi:DNA-binding transcriptional MerR regulator|nr:MAG: MerR family transcriptional regulator [Deltaproteobacteria bacterium HGW-Deltaproteobacteria-20]
MGSSDGTQVSKLYYRIGEVAKLLGVETSAIRHWESEFPGLRPRRTKTGQRMYSQHELQRLQEIKRLRFDQGYTIRGARMVLRSKGLEVREPQDPLVLENDRLRESLIDLRGRILQFIDELERERPHP